MLDTIPSLRKDRLMCLGYDFLMENLFSITETTLKLFADSEKLLNDVLMASAVSPDELNNVIQQKLDEVYSLSLFYCHLIFLSLVD